MMKRILVVLALCMYSQSLFSQGTILGFTVSPASPSTSDFVRVFTHLQFSSMGCDVDNQGHTTAAGTTDAYAHHCLGMLSAICDHTDTFNLGYLPAGPHLFRLTLSSGFGGPPCSPGIVPDDNDTISFNVLPTVGIDEINGTSSLQIFPNPFSTETLIRLNSPLASGELFLYDIIGKEVRKLAFSGTELLLSKEDLKKGIYFIRITAEHQQQITGKVIVQ